MIFASKTVRDESRTLSAWLRSREISQDELSRFGFRTSDTNLEFRAMASANSPLVESAFFDGFMETMDQLNVVRKAATLIPTDNGEELQVPTIDDTDEVGGLIDENDDLAADDILIGGLTLGAYRYGSGMLKLSGELLDDAAPATMGQLGQTLAKRAARLANTHFTTGTGTNQPQGLVTGSTLGKTAAADDAIVFADILDLQHSLSEVYWPRAAWMMNKATFKILRLLVDGNGEPAFLGGKLLGSSVLLNPSMPNIGAEAKPLLYGDFSNYLVRETPLQVRRHREKYAELGQVGLSANVRADGRLAIPASVRHLLMNEA